MDLGAVQYFYAADDRLTSVSIMLSDPDHVSRIANQIVEIVPETMEVMTWDEMLIEIVQGIEGDNITGLFMLGILYVVVGFGILGTVLMATMERKREFGIMVAVGMRRTKLAIIVFIETLIINLLGILSGIIVSIPVILYLNVNPVRIHGEAAEAMLEFNVEPVLPFILEPGFFINNVIVVLILTLLAVIYPLMVIGKFRLIPALRGK